MDANELGSDSTKSTIGRLHLDPRPRLIRALGALAFCAVIAASSAIAQDRSEQPVPLSVPPAWVLGFGAFVIGLEVLVLIRRNAGWYAESMQVIGLTLILTLLAYFVTAGYLRDQSGVLGLLGTAAGFLFGKASPRGQGG